MRRRAMLAVPLNPALRPHSLMTLRHSWSMILMLAAVVAAPLHSASAQVLHAAQSENNGGNDGWAIFFDLQATGDDVLVTELTTFSQEPAFALFSVELFTRNGTALAGAGASNAGWTSLGSFVATQGAVTEGESSSIDVADFLVSSGGITGVALRFTGLGALYLNGSNVYSDANLSLTTGESRSDPFSNTGGVFDERSFAGSVTYQVIRTATVPEPSTALLLLAGGIMLFAARQRRRLPQPVSAQR